jgi:outer membrane protein OmpA-like peptidoglycan-associated protein
VELKRSSIRSFASAVALFFALFLLSSESSNAALISDTLREHQVVRDNLFSTLSAGATNYTFKYVVITLPAGTIPGKDFPIPVSHIRYESTVLFAFNESTLQPNAEPILRDFAKVILKDTALRSLLIVGHTDAIGDEAYNINLSKKRAFTVAATLQASGVIGKYIHIVPMGKQQPFATNSTREGRQLNRRVEFFVSDVPEATETAVRIIRFNPCFRNDHEPGAPCDDTPKRIPIFSPDSDSRPVGQLNLTAKAPERSKLPDVTLERPPLPGSDDSGSSK